MYVYEEKRNLKKVTLCLSHQDRSQLWTRPRRAPLPSVSKRPLARGPASPSAPRVCLPAHCPCLIMVLRHSLPLITTSSFPVPGVLLSSPRALDWQPGGFGDQQLSSGTLSVGDTQMRWWDLKQRHFHPTTKFPYVPNLLWVKNSSKPMSMWNRACEDAIKVQ